MDQSDTQQVAVIDASAATAPEKGEQYLTFSIGDGLYGIPIGAVESVQRIPAVTVVPGAPDAVSGIFHMRGQVIVVIDPTKRFQFDLGRSFAPEYLILMKTPHYGTIGMLVEHVRTIVSVRASQIQTISEIFAVHIDRKYVRGIVMVAKALMEPPRKVREPAIMIEPKHVPKTPSSSEAEPPADRPLLLLRAEQLLSEDEILSVGKALSP